MSDFVLDDFDWQPTSVMEIVPPGGTDAIGTITFAGPAHPKTTAQADRVAQQALHEAALKEQASVNGRKWKADRETVDSIRAKNIDFVVGRMLGWSGIKRRDADGRVSEYPFSEDAARELFNDRAKGWLFQACLDFLQAEMSFTKRSSTV